MSALRRVALVTGASRGIGRATALAFARRGVDVAVFGRPSAASDTALDELRAEGARARAFACDVASEADVERATAALVEELGVPEFVVNNAGIVRRGALVEDTAVADWDDVIAVNLRGPFLVTRALLGRMRELARGRFIYVASISSTLGSPRNAAYAASKWGLLGLMKSVAEELRDTPIVAAAVLPGSVDTDMLAGSGFEPAMTAADVANTIVYLAMDAPSAIRGSAVEVFG
ncbi:MAG: SDR family NAD(P)-dependent oxidoreductase [Polyangiaceae bacterium]